MLFASPNPRFVSSEKWPQRLYAAIVYERNLYFYIHFNVIVFPGTVSLTSQQIQKALKFSKYAASALQYEDVNTAISNLEKALTLLKTGRET